MIMSKLLNLEDLLKNISQLTTKRKTRHDQEEAGVSETITSQQLQAEIPPLSDTQSDQALGTLLDPQVTGSTNEDLITREHLYASAQTCECVKISLFELP